MAYSQKLKEKTEANKRDVLSWTPVKVNEDKKDKEQLGSLLIHTSFANIAETFNGPQDGKTMNTALAASQNAEILRKVLPEETNPKIAGNFSNALNGIATA